MGFSSLKRPLTAGVLFCFLLAMGGVSCSQTETPCSRPISYRLGTVDERFGMSREGFAECVRMAADLWAQPLRRPLFKEDPHGVLEINLIYDFRQQATDQLKRLNFNLDRSRNSYQELRAHYDRFKAEYEEKKGRWQRELEAYNERVRVFNAEAESINRKGGTDRSTYERLMREKSELQALWEGIRNQQEELQRSEETVNNLAVVINEIAYRYQLEVVDYQNLGRTLGQEFCEGTYESRAGRSKITIYQLDNPHRLVRVLAHELGHALGLDHSPSEGSIMYRLINSDSLELSADDVNLLKKRCGGK